MLFILAVLLFIGWLLGFVAFKVTVGFIHILLAVAIILFIVALFRGGGRTRVV